MRRSKRAGAAPRGAKGKSKVGDIVLTTLAIGAVGVVGYLGWQYVKKRRQKKEGNLDETLLRNTTPGMPDLYPLNPMPGSTATPPITEPRLTNPLPALPTMPSYGGGSGSSYSNAGSSASDDFPLQKGSKGDNVRALQEALIRKHGRSILPKYGADGGFGSETAAALKKLKLPATVSETLFNVLTGGGSATGSGSSTDLTSLGTWIYQAAIRKDFSTVMSLLKQISSSADYSTVSETFKKYRLNGVRQTLVNGLLNTFKSASQKEQLRLAFAKMGLSYDGSKWSLAGIDGIPIITVRPTRIWVNARTGISVPARMVLGHEIARKLNYILFANNGRYFLVHSGCVRPL